MKKRITIMLDKDNHLALRELQSKTIKTTNKSYSFSQIINLVVAVGLKKRRKKKSKL